MPRDKMTMQSDDVRGGSMYTFPHNPRKTFRLHKQRRTSELATYRSNAIFDWWFYGDSEADGLIGMQIPMSWPYMNNSFWNVLKSFYESDGPITWDPGDIFSHESGKTYTVMPIALTSTDMPQNASHKKDVQFVVEIRSVVV